MKVTLAAVLLASATASAHRLDEYLQATLISVEKDRVQAQIRLVPGVAVLPMVLASIDSNADGVISASEQQAYAQRVLRDLSFTIDGEHLKPQLISVKFPPIEDIKEGLGEIQLEVTADLSPNGHNRKLIFENHHQTRIAAYLVNALVPRDPDIHLLTQNRNYDQSFYRLEYVQAGGHSGPWWLGALALLLFTRLALLQFRLSCDRKEAVLSRIRRAYPAPVFTNADETTGRPNSRYLLP